MVRGFECYRVELDNDTVALAKDAAERAEAFSIEKGWTNTYATKGDEAASKFLVGQLGEWGAYYWLASHGIRVGTPRVIDGPGQEFGHDFYLESNHSIGVKTFRRESLAQGFGFGSLLYPVKAKVVPYPSRLLWAFLCEGDPNGVWLVATVAGDVLKDSPSEEVRKILQHKVPYEDAQSPMALIHAARVALDGPPLEVVAPAPSGNGPKTIAELVASFDQAGPGGNPAEAEPRKVGTAWQEPTHRDHGLRLDTKEARDLLDQERRRSAFDGALGA